MFSFYPWNMLLVEEKEIYDAGVKGIFEID